MFGSGKFSENFFSFAVKHNTIEALLQYVKLRSSPFPPDQHDKQHTTMENLSQKDWRLLNRAVEKLNSDFDPRTLTARTLAAASTIIAADSVVFTGISYSDEYSGMAWDNAEALSSSDMKIFADHLHEHPLFRAINVERRVETLKITDLVSRQEFYRTTLYNELYRRMKIANQLITPLLISDDFFVACAINTSRPEFSERDRQVLTLLAPHLANAIRNAFAYQRLSGALDTEACGIIALGSNGKPLFISEFARRLFENYFAGEKWAADALPASINDWIGKINLSVEAHVFAAPAAPLKITTQNGEITVRLAFNRQTGERTLLLEEKRAAMPQSFVVLGLTPRESEILFWITQGKTDAVIALLCAISPRTVQKHVENIFIKLGVETRTAAMLRAFDVL